MPPLDKLPGPRYGALLQLLRTAEALWNSSRLFFARWDLSPSQFNVLNLLCDHPDGCTQIELSRQLIMHRSNVTGLIDRLEQRALLQRTPETDRRVNRIVLTAAGAKLVRRILPEYYRVAEMLWGQLPARRTQRLVADLLALDGNIQQLSQQLERR